MHKVNQYGLSDRDVETIFAIFRKYPEVRSVYLFGSRATGKWKAGSDIDLVIKGEQLRPAIFRSLKLDFEESDLPLFVDIHQMSMVPEGPFMEHIKQFSREFYEQEKVDAVPKV